MFSGHIGNFPFLKDMLPRLREAVLGRSEVDAFVDPEAWLNGAGRWRTLAETQRKSEGTQISRKPLL
ncbi:hypothetical protein [Bradyrhizobium semiaridum]|uniref:hypothetical protein n=1 Tax=Bradyrhizobium semiaridum TaxID=2821404 RepID=UPI0035D7042D